MGGGNPNPNQDQRGQFRAAKNIKTCAIQDRSGPTWMSLCRETEKNKGGKLLIAGVLFCFCTRGTPHNDMNVKCNHESIIQKFSILQEYIIIDLVENLNVKPVKCFLLNEAFF